MNVVVERLPERLVAAIGFRGGYSRKNYESALEKLEEWLGERPGLSIAGKPYAVYWDPPFVAVTGETVRGPYTRRESAGMSEPCGRDRSPPG